jgi:signal transduction histidine kinase
MSLDPTLSVRRWFERRPVILAATAVGFAAVGTAVRTGGDPGLGALYVLPVMLAALELGLLGGLVAAGAASALVVASGTVAPAVAAVAVGAVAGRFSDQMRALLEQRRGFGRLLDAQEDDRRRHARTLHEELAQVLAAVLMSLRTLRRRGVDDASLDELDGQVAGVLDELRDIATELRPPSLAQLGLLPALVTLERLTVEADGLPEPVPEPLRTGAYRLVEYVVSAAEPGARARLSASGSHLNLTLDATIRGIEPVTAARARVALLNGSLHTESLPAGRTRLRVQLPLQTDGTPVAPTGSVARTMVHPATKAISR